MKFRKLLLGSLGFIALSFGGEVDQFLNSLGVSLSSGNSVEAQSRGYYFGGGASYRAPSATLQPFQVVPPSIRSGCGGIDITFGSFSYLNPEYFIDFAQKVIAQAPGFAFDIALDIMCPQCSSIMKRLTALSNQINAMSMNSCQLLANLGNRIRSEVLNEDVAGGGSDSWLQAIDNTLNDWSSMMSKFNNYLTNLGCNNPNCYLFAGYQSIADRFVSEISGAHPYWNTTNMKYFVRALFGDVIKVPGTPPGTKCVRPLPGLEEVILELAKNPSNVYLPGFDDDGNGTPVPIAQTTRGYVHNTLNSIVNKILNKQPLSATDLDFLARYDIPALGLLRILSPSPSALLTIQDSLEEYLAYELTYQFIASLYLEYGKFATKIANLMKEDPAMKEDDKECIKEIISLDHAKDTLPRLKMEVDRRKEAIVQKIRVALDLYEMERFVYSKFSRHPLMASYMFGSLMK